MCAWARCDGHCSGSWTTQEHAYFLMWCPRHWWWGMQSLCVCAHVQGCELTDGSTTQHPCSSGAPLVGSPLLRAISGTGRWSCHWQGAEEEDGEERSGEPGGDWGSGRKTLLQREILCALQLLVWIETRWCAGTPARLGDGGAKHMVNG